jgi:inorganic pyrophosphatase
VKEIVAIIEISQNNPDRIKYEVCRKTGLLKVDRMLPEGFMYPHNYGFIPSTLAPDGDCADILVLFPSPIASLATIAVRVVGALAMSDEHGEDNKLIAVPIHEVSDEYDSVHSLNDIPKERDEIYDFFKNYKKDEKSKFVNIKGWMTKEEATLSLHADYTRFRNKGHREGER